MAGPVPVIEMEDPMSRNLCDLVLLFTLLFSR